MWYRSCLCFIAALCASLALAGNGGDTESGARALADRLSAIRNLQAEFSQRVLADDGELLEASSGHMAFQRPHQLRWDIVEPYRYRVMTDGGTLWRYDVDFEQLNTENFASAAQTPMMILAADAAELARRYDVVETESDERGTRYELTPKAGSESDFSWLALVFEGHVLVAMELLDNLGQRTEIRLQNAQINGNTLPDERFVFSADEAVDP